jgi:hypothetical protein
MWRAFRRSEKDECSKARELLPGYMDRCLNGEEATRVEGHLKTCPGCREELESLRATVVLLHRLPEVTPSRSFAVTLARPVPGRRALPALRFATAGVVLLLVLAFAADQTNVFEREEDTGTYLAAGTISEEDEAYWIVAGVKNDVDADSPMPAELVVPDGSDNVAAAVNSLALANNGVLYGNVVYGPDEAPQVVLTEDGEGATVGVTPTRAFYFSGQASDNAHKSAISMNSWDYSRGLEVQDGSYLNMLSSDNNVLYSFDLSDSERVATATPDNDWLRPLEYGLIGLVGVLGGVTAALWLRQRRARAAEAGTGKN